MLHETNLLTKFQTSTGNTNRVVTITLGYELSVRSRAPLDVKVKRTVVLHVTPE